MIFASGLSSPEGPVLLQDGTWLVCEMGPDRGCVTRISKDGKEKTIVAQTGRPNGLAVNVDGDIFVAESQTRALLRLSLGGEQETLLRGCDGEPFLFPNDLCFGPDGALYMTDSGVLLEEMMPGGEVRPDFKAVRTDGRVYRIDNRNLKITKLDDGLRFANGIAFGPDRHLYVTESQTGVVYRYRWDERGSISERQCFSNVVNDLLPGDLKAPDGIAFGADGKLYITVFGQGDVTVLSPTGEILERFKTAGRYPTNIAFGAQSESKLFVTEVELGQVEVFEATSAGLPLFS